MSLTIEGLVLEKINDIIEIKHNESYLWLIRNPHKKRNGRYAIYRDIKLISKIHGTGNKRYFFISDYTIESGKLLREKEITRSVKEKSEFIEWPNYCGIIEQDGIKKGRVYRLKS
jgi:hypothetical protein